MELAFATRDLRTLCENSDVARDVFGTPAADQLKARLADLRASDNLQEFLKLGLPGVGVAKTIVTIELSQGRRMLLKSNHRPPGEATEWQRVRRVQVIAIDEEVESRDER
jgi:hypothetical protein